MRKSFKKAIASVMAAATLSVGVSALTTSAIDATGYVKTSTNVTLGTAATAVSSTSVISSTDSYDESKVISVQLTGTSGGTVTGSTYEVAYYSYHIGLHCYGTGITRASTHHYIKRNSDNAEGTCDLVAYH